MRWFDYWQFRIVFAMVITAGVVVLFVSWLYLFLMPGSGLDFTWVAACMAGAFVVALAGSGLLVKDLKTYIRGHEITKKSNQFDIINAVHETLLREVELDKVLEKIIALSMKAIPAAEKGSVLILNEEKQILEVRAQIGYDDALMKTFSLRLGEGYGGEAVAWERISLFMIWTRKIYAFGTSQLKLPRRSGSNPP